MSTTTRRGFLTTTGAGVAGALAATAHAAEKPQAPSVGEKTWLTYAVNIEMIWGNLTVPQRLKNVAEAGFTHYEFWPWKNKNIDEMVKLNAELGLVPVQFSAFWGITNPTRKPEFLQAVKDAIPVAKKLGVKKMCVVAGETTDSLSIDEQNKAVVEALKAAADIVGPEDIMIILEPLNVLVNHPRQLVVTSKHAAQILKAVGSPHVKMLFDCYHQQISEGNLTGNIRKYKELIGYFQIADHPGRHEPGTGEVNWGHVLRVIHDIGYRDAIGLELSPHHDAKAALKAVRQADAEARERSI